MADRCLDAMHNDGCLTCKERHADWFCNLSPAALAEFDAIGMHMMVPPGGNVFFEGQPPRGVYVLCAGHVKLSASSKEGKTLVIRIAKPGDVLGLSAAIAGTAYETAAQAIESVEVKSFQRQDFLRFIERHIDGSLHAAKMLNREYRDALGNATRLALSSSIAGRMARLLLGMAWEQGEAMPRFVPRIAMSYTHEDLAAMLGTTRETVTRVLNEMKRKEIIAIKGTWLTILRKDALDLLA
jgi:CRP/FNR family transcriptional regulator